MTQTANWVQPRLVIWAVCILVLLVVGCQSDKSGSKEGAGDGATAEAGSESSGDSSSLDAEAGAAKALEIADRVMDNLGGENAWRDTRYLSWVFFGGREYWWDKTSGDVRIETNDSIVLFNLKTGDGRAMKAGEELTDPVRLRGQLKMAMGWWENDSYWMFMPFTLRDEGVNLAYKGEGMTTSDVLCDVIEVTFDPGYRERDNAKYDVYVSKEDGMVLQWSHYPRREREEPQFTLPWGGWQTFGKIKLATKHGQGKDWKITVPETMPASVFQSFDPVVS